MKGAKAMSYYTTCPKCGANLDPGEKCTCTTERVRESYEAGSRYYPVDGYIKSKTGAVVPLVDIPQMSDKKWQKAAARNAVDNYAREHGKPPESPETALKWQRQKCEKP
jgi:hypothetical protein